MDSYIYRDEWQKNYNKKKFDRDYLLTSPSGNWEFVNEKEMEEIESVRIERTLFEKLEKKGLIITENNASMAFNLYRGWNKNKFNGPGLHIIETTKNCNLQCTYCHVSAKHAENENFNNLNLSEETAKEIVDFIFQTPSKFITIEFQGGESLLNFPVIKFIVEYAKEKNIEFNKSLNFSLVTNLIALTEEHCDFLDEHKINYCSSLDGPRFIHDKQRVHDDGEGSFLEFVESVKLLQEKGMQTPSVLTVITKESMPYYKEIVDMHKDLGRDKINFIYVNSLGYARENWNELGTPEVERLEHHKKVLDYILEKWGEGVFIEERMFSLALSKIFDDREVSS